MGSTGINRETGQILTDLDHVRQSFKVIFTTHIGTRVMRRTFGSKVPKILGRNMVPSTIIRFVTAIYIAVYLWEPRLRNVLVLFPAPPNTPLFMRVGKLGMAIQADYCPNALQGDFTTDVQRIYLF